ncbi:MAG: ankyrin repeat domain-containing protein, partial [Cytophagales bacterium]|nr:ankyrin repeat domain-containing protein [Cytophagales bacterium]
RYGASEKLLGQAKTGSHKLLMLSRPYGIEQERLLADLEIEHAGFSDGQMEDYVKGDLRDLPSELVEGLLSFIRAYPAIGAIAHVPVNLQILCFLWREDSPGVREETLRGSLPGLYRRLTRYLWKRYTERHKEENLQNKDREALFDTLGEIALKTLKKGEVLISQGLVDEVLEECSIAKEVVKESGFLLLEEVGQQYQFPHLTFQEYFAGRWLARQLLSNEAKVRKKGEKFFTKHKYAPQYGRMLSFLSGEVSKEKEVDDISKLLSLLEEGPQEVVGVQHVLLQMRLLNEWLCVAGEDLKEDLNTLEEDFHVMASLKDWFVEGLDQVRREDDRQLLSLLTTGLQGSRAVAAHAPALLELLRKAMRDSDSYVRIAASEALLEVAKAAPEHAEQVLKSLLEASRDEDSYVRRAASSALGEISLQQLIDTYWATQNQALIQLIVPLIATRLYHTPLLVRTRSQKQNHQQVVLYPTAGQHVKWEKPLQEVQNFVQQIKSAQRNSALRVREAASYVSREVVKAPPEHAAKVIQLLGETIRNEADYVRSFAIEALGAVLKAAPQHAEQVFEGADVNQAASNGRTLLMSAAEQGHLEVAQFLVDQGAAVNQADSDGWTPLMIAAYQGHIETVQYLVGQGATVNQAKNNGATPLMAAAWYGHLEVAQYLVEQGAAVNQVRHDGVTPLWIAAQKGYLEVVKYLQEKGANIEATDEQGTTPLMIATQNGHSGVAQFLVKQGAALNQ